MRMAFTGRHERMTAARAYELGIISQVVDPPERCAKPRRRSRETIARNSPDALAAHQAAASGAALETT